MKTSRKPSSRSLPVVSGTLDITRSGLGFVTPTAAGDIDILVRPNDFNKAFHGDKVLVQITKDPGNGKKKEGKIKEVLQRKTTLFKGSLRKHSGRWFFIPDADKPLPHFELEEEPNAEIDEEGKVIVRFVRWEKADRRPIAAWVENVNSDNLNDVAMKEILMTNGFPLQFTPDALEESARLSEAITPAELKIRRDLRPVLTFTIDPADARDFDDALSIQPVGKNNWEIGVHIADVSHFVTEHTALNEEAYQRATSVYLPDRVNPMLPEHISNQLCSLRPNEDKYTFSAIFTINAKGQIKDTWLGKTVIHSNHRFSYEEAQEIIEGKENPIREQILTLNAIARILRKERFSNGAINFSSQEVRFKLDDKGKPIGIVVKESKEAHQLIEEFMLLANRAVAARFSQLEIFDKPVPFPYRVHDLPDVEKLIPFIAFAKKFGYKFDASNGRAIAKSFNKMLEEAKGTPQQHVLEQLGIRTMAKAVYSTKNVGHYGLGFDNYCHFTSPIRRYPDIIVHRLLQQMLEEKIVIDKKLEEKCKHCSERERNAMDCERSANKYKQVEFLSNYLGEEFEAIISGVSTFGFWAETVAHKCEGLISVRDLNYYDDFRLIESDYSLVGLGTGRKFRMGDTIRIRVIGANLEKKQLDYEWVPPASTPETIAAHKAAREKEKKQDQEKRKPAKKPTRSNQRKQ